MQLLINSVLLQDIYPNKTLTSFVIVAIRLLQKEYRLNFSSLVIIINNTEYIQCGMFL